MLTILAIPRRGGRRRGGRSCVIELSIVQTKKTRRPFGLRVNPIQEELEETGAILAPAIPTVCFIVAITVIRFAYITLLLRISLH